MDTARRKALKLAYRLAFPPMGVFAVRNTASGRMLLASSRNLTGSLNRHRMELQQGVHRNAALMADWRALGEAAFAFDVLAQVEERTDPGWDPSVDLDRLLAEWLGKVPPGSALSYR